MTDMYQFEAEAMAEGAMRVAGIDEAGRGPLAGPVVAAAVWLAPGMRIDGVNDSKQLSQTKRESLYDLLIAHDDVCYAIAVVDANEVDRINILQATYVAMRRAASALDPAADFLLVDGRPVPKLPLPSRSIIKGDAKSASIAAASILAKVHRDALMRAYDVEFPGYGFAKHKGYGTAVHLEALTRQGACPIHRRSFSPVARVLNGGDQPELELGSAD
ncbi:MAG: ribonuclease HII [Rhodothermales bacterium]|jgi:ribonuclease HII